MYGVQRRLRRRPDGRAPAAGQCRHSGGPAADAGFAQRPEPRERCAYHGAFAGHGPRSLLHHQAPQGREGRRPGVLRRRGGDHRLQRGPCRPARHREVHGRRPGRAGQRGARAEGDDHRPHPLQPGGSQGGRLYQRDSDEAFAARHHRRGDEEGRCRQGGRVPRRHQEHGLPDGLPGRSVVQPRCRDHPRGEGEARAGGLRTFGRHHGGLQHGSDHQQRALQPDHRRLDEHQHQADEGRDRNADQGQRRFQPGVHDARLRRPWFEGADPSAERYARSDGQAAEIGCRGRSAGHREPDPLELQGGTFGARVLHLDPRCP